VEICSTVWRDKKSLAAHGHVADREGDGMLYSIPLILSLRAMHETCILGDSRLRFLGSFANFRKANIRFVRPSFFMGQLNSH